MTDEQMRNLANNLQDELSDLDPSDMSPEYREQVLAAMQNLYSLIETTFVLIRS